jgi:hypothetical protein
MTAKTENVTLRDTGGATNSAPRALNIKKYGYVVTNKTLSQLLEDLPALEGEYVRTTGYGFLTVNGQKVKFRLYWSASRGGRWFREEKESA